MVTMVVGLRQRSEPCCMGKAAATLYQLIPLLSNETQVPPAAKYPILANGAWSQCPYCSNYAMCCLGCVEMGYTQVLLPRPPAK
jgi:hypothetical protein